MKNCLFCEKNNWVLEFIDSEGNHIELTTQKEVG